MSENIVIYTDGGARPNPGRAGLGIVLVYGKHRLEKWEYLGHATNNIAELTAILRALEAIKDRKKRVLVYADSSYAIGVCTGAFRARLNLELIEKIRSLMRKFPALELKKVPGHAGVAENERVDALAAYAIEHQNSGEIRMLDGVTIEDET